MDIEGIKSDFVSIWVAFVESIVRFFNNRFHKGSEEISYLREQIALLQTEKRELIKSMISPISQVKEDEEDREFKPVTSGRHIPWPEKRRQLEFASRQRAVELQQQASLETERSKSTEQLEEELGIRN